STGGAGACPTDSGGVLDALSDGWTDLQRVLGSAPVADVAHRRGSRRSDTHFGCTNSGAVTRDPTETPQPTDPTSSAIIRVVCLPRMPTSRMGDQKRPRAFSSSGSRSSQLSSAL